MLSTCCDYIAMSWLCCCCCSGAHSAVAPVCEVLRPRCCCTVNDRGCTAISLWLSCRIDVRCDIVSVDCADVLLRCRRSLRSWSGRDWLCLAWTGLTLPGLARPGLAWPGLALPGLPSPAWPGSALPCLARPALVCLGWLGCPS